MAQAGHRHRFLGAVSTPSPAVIVLGIPLDVTESFKPGTREGPARVRLVSESLEMFSPATGRDLTELPLADWGDIGLPEGDMEAALARIAAAIEPATRQALPLMIGGEHTATLGALRAVRRVHPEIFVIQLDAHLDLRDTYNGLALSHATVMRRVAEEIGFDHVVQCGIRSGTREEFELARLCLASDFALQLAPVSRDRIGSHPVYLTVDIDVLDPAAAPGTGCPEPGGPSFAEVASFIHSLAGLQVVAADVMEVLPAADSNDITSIAAAKLIREIALRFGPPCP